MRNFLALLLVLIGSSFAGAVTVRAQLPEGYVEVFPQRSIPTGWGRSGVAPCSIREDGVFDQAALQKLFTTPKCEASIKAMNLDLSRQTLVGYSVGGDCHMRVSIRTFRSDRDKKYLTIINNIYGGCRAGGWRSGWIVLDKMPAGYTLEVKEVRVDRIHSLDDETVFKFPKLPTGIPPEVLESRTVDIRGCLPMTGQSQWVFIKKDFLLEGIDRYPDQKAECTEVLANLDIDFDKYDLAGYNVNTGDCARPDAMEARVVKDYDEVVYRLEISYPKPAKPCDVLTYHPLWVVVPKAPSGYSFRIEAKARD